MLSPEDLQQVQQEIERASGASRFNVTSVQQHAHIGTDSPRVSYLNLTNRQFIASVTIPGDLAGDDQYYGIFFIAPFECSVQAIYITHASNAGSPVLMAVQALHDGDLPNPSAHTIQSFDLSVGATFTGYSKLIRGRRPVVLSEFEKLGLYIPSAPTGCTQLVVSVVLEY